MRRVRLLHELRGLLLIVVTDLRSSESSRKSIPVTMRTSGTLSFRRNHAGRVRRELGMIFIRQESAKINNSSNISRGWIDSRAKRRYSQAQIPDLVAIANSRIGRKLQHPDPASRIESGFAPHPNRPVPALLHKYISRFGPAARAADIRLILSPETASSRKRRRHTSTLQRAGGRQIL